MGGLIVSPGLGEVAGSVEQAAPRCLAHLREAWTNACRFDDPERIAE